MATSGWHHVVSALTMARAGIGVVVLVFLESLPANSLLPLAALATLTDALDGWLARRYRVATPGGAAFDLLADGLFFVACIVALWRLDVWPTWLVGLLLASGLPEVAAQGVMLVRDGRVGSPRRWWNRLVGGYGYVCLLAVFAGSPAVPWGLGLVVVAAFANLRDLWWTRRSH